MSEPKVIVVREEETLMLTTLGKRSRTCIYVSLEGDGLVLTTGFDTVERIEGDDMRQKVLGD